MTDVINAPHPTQEPISDEAIIVRKAMMVMQEISRIKYDAQNAHQSYGFVSWQQALEMVRPHLIKFGLHIWMDAPDEPILSASGKFTHAVQRFRFTVTDIETGASVVKHWFGESKDTSDKALTQAASAATKYFLRSFFLLPFSDKDDDADAKVNTGRTADVILTLLHQNDEGQFAFQTSPDSAYVQVPNLNRFNKVGYALHMPVGKAGTIDVQIPVRLVETSPNNWEIDFIAPKPQPIEEEQPLEEV